MAIYSGTGHHICTLSRCCMRQSSLFANKASSTSSVGISKGYVVVYVGESELKRFVVPISFLSQPLFQELLSKAEEQFGYNNYPMGGLIIPCREDMFFDLTCRLNGLF